MKTVAVDTLYWIAQIRPDDQWKEPARRARQAAGQAQLLTTDEVLGEFLTAMAKGGPQIRDRAIRTVQAIMNDPNTKVVPQSRETFLKARDLYASRADKEYSMVDCALMSAMRAEGVQEVLTNDHHFGQEGFAVLIRRDA